jgi:hypothetical protein
MNLEKNVNPVKIALLMFGVVVVLLWLTTALTDAGWIGRSAMSTALALITALIIIVGCWRSNVLANAWTLLVAGAMLHMAFTSLMNDYPVFDVMYTWLFWGPRRSTGGCSWFCTRLPRQSRCTASAS